MGRGTSRAHDGTEMKNRSTSAAAASSLTALHNRLFFRVFQVGNMLQRQAAQEIGISSVQWAVLGALSSPRYQEGMTVTQLAEHLAVSRQNLDGVLTRLERDGHVLRVPDATDKRTRRVTMTEGGWAFWNRLQETIEAFYAQSIHDFSFDDKVACVHFLNKLLINMRNVKLG